MTPSLLAACLLTTALQGPTPGQVRPLFAEAAWYKAAPGEAKTQEGIVELTPGEGRLGLPPRFAAFRLTWLEDGKAVSRPIYTNGQDALLGALSGYRVRLTAKLVEQEGPAGKVTELWPAQVEVIGLAPPGGLSEWPVIAQREEWLTQNLMATQKRPLVFRDPKAIARAFDFPAAMPNADKVATELVGNFFGRQHKIDWSQHMILLLPAGLQAAGSNVEVVRISSGEKGLEVLWRISRAPGGNGGGVWYPARTLLLKRYDGPIRVQRVDRNDVVTLEGVAGDKEK